MRAPRTLILVGLGAVSLWLAGPRIRAARESLRTSSAPGAGVYELAAGLALGGHYRDMTRDCADAIRDVPEPSVLEIGPGPGHLAERLLERLPDSTWTGVDIDPAMLRAAGRRLERAGLHDRATLVEADVARLPFPDGSFHLVVSSLSAHHWPDAAGGFAEIRRVLRPDGRALVYDLPAHMARFETPHAGLEAARTVFGRTAWRRHRGLGPLTLVWRVDLRP